MRKNFGAKPWTSPQPVFSLATYNEDGTPDAMNAAWGGISEEKELSMCISAEHKTHRQHPGPQGVHREHGYGGADGGL